MRKWFEKPGRWAAVYSFLLTGMFVFTLLDAFMIPRALEKTEAPSLTESAEKIFPDSAEEAVVTGASYKSEQISIAIETVRRDGTTLYVADIRLSNIAYLKTALAQNTYGRNIKATTSAQAEENNAIFAVNGDYYGFRDTGLVVRNGTLYRDAPRGSGEEQALVIDMEGNFSVIKESAFESSILENAWQAFSFGPALMENGEVTVSVDAEVGKAMASNPRTAVGQVSGLHYIVIVSDGRTEESEGLSLFQLAQEFADRGCVTAYNLDGGGSSTMYFNGQVVNKPANGRSNEEREVSDIVYIGKE